MSALETLFGKSQLAEAAYSNFINASTGTVFNTDAQVQAVLVDGEFSISQAANFVTQWRVLDQYTAPSNSLGFGGTGFSATLFQNIHTNGFTFAIRGTEPGFADLVADVNDIVVDGIAMDQLVDMFNYWQRLTTAPGVSYSAARLIASDEETAQLRALQLLIPVLGVAGYNAYIASLTNSGAILDSSLGFASGVRRIERLSSSIAFQGTVLEMGAGKISAANPLDVVGHSLGGHLASAFTRLFPLVPAQAVTVNGAGFPTGSTLGLSGYALSNIQNLFGALNGGANFDPSKIYNVHGSGPTFVTMNNQYGLVQPGSTQEVYIESSFPAPNHTFGHGVAQVTDSLAVYDLFAQLDSALRAASLAEVNAKLKPMFESTSAIALGSLERSVNALVKALSLDFPVLADEDDREGLFKRIVALQSTITSLTSANPAISIELLVNKDLPTITANSFVQAAYRYALKELNTFAILGLDSLFTVHNTGVFAGALDLYDAGSGRGSITQSWIEDRAKLLAALIAGNTQDNPQIARIPGSGDITTEYTYYAADEAHTFFADPVDRSSGQLRTQVVQFADDQGRELIGSDFLLGDRLYGGIGRDVLLGKRGDDVLEGGLGKDYLSGEEGNDTLISLDNSPGDRLRGGTGNDIYYADFGDSIADTPESSGSGRVYVGADKVLLTGGTRKQDESFFKSGDGRFVYSTDGVGAIYVREVGRAGEALKIDTPTGSVPGLSDDGSTVTTGRPDLGIALVTHFEARPRPPEVSGTPSIAQLFKLAGTWKPRKDPLALDLGAPGLHTLEDLGEGIVRFDHDGNGSRTGTGWLTGEDAWVVLDRDGDGEISIGAELFGVDTQLPEGTLAHNGYEAIAPLDTNGDHRVDSNDAALEEWQIRADVDGNGIIGNEEYRAASFDDLQLWRDTNHNGYSEPFELSTITEEGIASIGTLMTPSGAELPGGNRLIGTSTFTRTDGSTGASGALDLARETFYRDFKSPPDYDPAVDGLPSAAGSGRVRNLQEAAASSPQLRAALLLAATAATREAQWGAMDEVLLQWADSSTLRGGTEAAWLQPEHALMVYRFGGIGSTSVLNAYNALTSGVAVDPVTLPADWYPQQQSQQYRDQVARIEVLERFVGQNFVDLTGTSPSAISLSRMNASATSPGWNYSVNAFSRDLSGTPLVFLNKSYEILKETVYGPIAAQTRLKPYIDAALLASESRNFSAVEELLLNTRAASPAEGLADLVELGRYVGVELIERGWIELPRLIETWSREALADTSLLSLTQSLRISVRDNVSGSGTFYGDIVLGSDWLPGYSTPAQMELRGLEGNDFLLGGAVYEIIYGGAGNDIISLGTGDKRVMGGGGRDLYIFGRASGTVVSDTYVWDPIMSEADLDVVQLLPGVQQSDVRVRRETLNPQFESAALSISIAGSSAKFIDNLFADNDSTSYRTLDALRFADGTSWDLLTLRLKTLEGSSSNDTLRGYDDSDDTIEGLGGNDFLRGMQGDDVLLGGEGNDVLEGGRGADVLDGGAGADQLYGGIGVDTYVLRADGGHDILNRANAGFILGDYYASFPDLDTIRVDSGIDPSQLRLLNSAGGLLVSLASGGASMRDTGNALNPDYNLDGPGIARIEFANGIFWDAVEIRRRSLLGATENGETIRGYANSNDAIAGQGGNDVLFGFGGADALQGDQGNDTLYGDAGDDQLAGGGGNDTLYGDAGDDQLAGGAGSDTLIGGCGDDLYTFSRGDGLDILVDAVALSDSSDVLRFTADISAEDIQLAVDADNLYIEIRDSTDAVTLSRGNLGLDRVEFADGTVWGHTTLTADSITRRGSAFADSLIGTGANDHLQGLAGNDALSGLGGSDMLEGGLGNDVLLGGAGGDILDGGAGDDRLEGGEGSDFYQFDTGFGRDLIVETGDAVEDVLRFLPGVSSGDIKLTRDLNFIYLEVRGDSDVISFARENLGLDRIEIADCTLWSREDLLSESVPFRVTSGNDLIYGGADGDTLIGLAGNDVIHGLEGADFLDGGVGNDLLLGNQGEDVLDGEDGNDHLLGNEGDDILIGSTGDDILEGGPGEDTYLIGLHHGNDRVLEVDNPDGDVDALAFGEEIAPGDILVTPQGDDAILTLRASGQTVTLVDWLSTPGARIETITFDDDTIWNAATIDSLLGDSLNIIGTDDSDDLEGGDAAEVIRGLGATDWISGGRGDDVLDGGDGDDYLSGEDGDDLLIGGEGSDYLSGGQGNDRYVFQPGFGIDHLYEEGRNFGGGDTIEFGAGIGPQDVKVHQSYGLAAIYLRFADPNDRLHIQDWRIYEDGVIEQVSFDDGSVWTSEEILSRIEVALPSAYDDILDVNVDADADGEWVNAQAGDDWLFGGAGNDVLRGDAGNDRIEDSRGINIFDGGEGDDQLLAIAPYSDAGGSAMIIGGAGNDSIDIYSPDSIVLFNRGDGCDWLYSEELPRFTLSLGGGIRLEDLDLHQDGYQLLLSLGDEDSIGISSDVEFSAQQIPQIILQIIDEGMVIAYDLSVAIRDFYLALDADLEISMSLASALQPYILNTSTSHAMGGDIAFRYATGGAYQSLTLAQIQSIVGSPEFGIEAQGITPLTVNLAPRLALAVTDLAVQEDTPFRFELPNITFSDPDALGAIAFDDFSVTVVAPQTVQAPSQPDSQPVSANAPVAIVDVLWTFDPIEVRGSESPAPLSDYMDSLAVEISQSPSPSLTFTAQPATGAPLLVDDNADLAINTHGPTSSPAFIDSLAGDISQSQSSSLTLTVDAATDAPLLVYDNADSAVNTPGPKSSPAFIESMAGDIPQSQSSSLTLPVQVAADAALMADDNADLAVSAPGPASSPALSEFSAGNPIQRDAQLAASATRDPDAGVVRGIGDWYAQGSSAEAQQLQLDAPSADGPANAEDSSRSSQSSVLAATRDTDGSTGPEAPSLWALSEALLQFHLATAIESALGVDQGAEFSFGFPLGSSLESTQNLIGAPGFGQDAQSMQSFGGLQEGLARLL